MTPARSHTKVPGHIGICGFPGLPSLPGALARPIPQEPVDAQSSVRFLSSSCMVKWPPQ